MKAMLIAADGAEYEVDSVEMADYILHSAPPDMTGATTGELRHRGPLKQYRRAMRRVDPRSFETTHSIYVEWDLGHPWPPCKDLIDRAEQAAKQWPPFDA